MKVHLFSKAILAVAAIFIFASFGGVRAARAQGAAAGAGAASPAKIGVINIRSAIVATAEGKQASTQLQAQFSPRQADLQSTQKQIEDIQRRMSEGARTLSQDEQARLQRQGELLSRKLQRGNDDLNEDLQAAQGDLVDTIGRKMLDVIDRYARENGFTVILDSSAQGTPVVYGSSQIDVTDEIVRLYDQAYPVKAAAAAEAPAAAPAAAPKPAPAAAPKKTTP